MMIVFIKAIQQKTADPSPRHHRWFLYRGFGIYLI